ncbi:MAG: hypothetical protein PHH28_08810 [Desulfuromonadaceae bacterium]|nr:hypothetical protein [Desulfuromonadaceae bacterium]
MLWRHAPSSGPLAMVAAGLATRIKNGAGIFADIFQHVWRFELFAVEDTVEVAGQKVITSRGVTVGKS